MSVPIRLSCGCSRPATEKAAKADKVYCRYHGIVSVESATFTEWHGVCITCNWGRWGSYGGVSYECGKHYRNKAHATFAAMDTHPGRIKQSADYLAFVRQIAEGHSLVTVRSMVTGDAITAIESSLVDPPF